MNIIKFERVEKKAGNFEKLARAIGYTDKIKKIVQKEIEVEISKAQAKFEELKANINGFGFLGAFKKDDKTEILKYTEEIEIDNDKTYLEFLEEKLNKLVDDFVINALLSVKKKELSEKAKEDLLKEEQNIKDNL